MGYCIIGVIISAIHDPSLVGFVAILMELFNMISFSSFQDRNKKMRDDIPLGIFAKSIHASFDYKWPSAELIFFPELFSSISQIVLVDTSFSDIS